MHNLAQDEWILDNPQLHHFIEAVNEVRWRAPDPRTAVAEIRPHFRELLHNQEWLPTQYQEPAEESGMGRKTGMWLLYRAGDGGLAFSALVLPPGAQTPVHDHLAWGLVGLYRGEQEEVVFQRKDDGARADFAQLEIAEQHLRQPASPGIVRGLSPHAPYSVHPQLLNRLMMLAQEHAVPVAMHLAETRDELELLDSGTGPLVDLLNDFGVWDPEFIPRGSKPLDYLRPLSQAERGLVIHGNYLSDEELDFLTRHPQLSVVYCPRTHAAMGHPPHPWQAMQQRGINVCIGTDSRASNPDLSIWEELRLLQGLAPELPASEILKFGTSNGAQALGISASHGRLAPGLNAQLLLAPLSPTALSDPELHLFREPASSLKWVDSSSSR